MKFSIFFMLCLIKNILSNELPSIALNRIKYSPLKSKNVRSTGFSLKLTNMLSFILIVIFCIFRIGLWIGVRFIIRGSIFIRLIVGSKNIIYDVPICEDLQFIIYMKLSIYEDDCDLLMIFIISNFMLIRFYYLFLK